jgi:thioredoxin 2
MIAKHSEKQEITHLSCPACLTTNRVMSSRLNEEPKCGHCAAPLLTDKPIELDETQFDQFISHTELPVLVDFWAPWCGPCRVMAPHFERAAAQLKGRVRLVKVNTEQSPALAARFHIRAIPTLVLYHAGKEVKRMSGALDTAELVKWVA